MAERLKIAGCDPKKFFFVFSVRSVCGVWVVEAIRVGKVEVRRCGRDGVDRFLGGSQRVKWFYV